MTTLALAALIGFSSLASGTALAAAPGTDVIRLPNYTNRFSQFDQEFTGHTTFRCAFSGIANTDDGHIKQGGFWASAFAEANDNFTFDASTGAYQSHGEVTMMNVVRQGDSQWDLIAHVPGGDPLATFMRIQAYSKPITFMMVHLTDVFAGTCVKL